MSCTRYPGSPVFFRLAITGAMVLLTACHRENRAPSAAPATDLIPVCLSDSRCGYIHPDGREAIPFRYGLAEAFAPCGLALVFDRHSETFGYIDATGRWRLGPGYPDARSFDSHGVALVHEASGRWRLLRCDGTFAAAFDSTAARALAVPMVTRKSLGAATADTS